MRCHFDATPAASLIFDFLLRPSLTRCSDRPIIGHFRHYQEFSLYPSKMADEDDINIGGKAISSLRVVDLKKECEKRGLTKSGSKSQLVERLKTVMLPGIFTQRL